MQVELAQVESGIDRSRDCNQPVGVSHVVGTQSTGVVNNAHDLVDVGVEDPGVLGIGDHEAGGSLGDRCLHRVNLDITALAGIDRDHAIAGGGRRRRVSRM